MRLKIAEESPYNTSSCIDLFSDALLDVIQRDEVSQYSVAESGAESASKQEKLAGQKKTPSVSSSIDLSHARVVLKIASVEYRLKSVICGFGTLSIFCFIQLNYSFKISTKL